MSTFPEKFLINYVEFLNRSIELSGTYQSICLEFLSCISDEWYDGYCAMSEDPKNIVTFPFHEFEYFFDNTEELYDHGEYMSNKDITSSRLMGVAGFSKKASQKRDANRIKGWLGGPLEKYNDSEQDKGHFIAHSIGGGLDVNLFHQSRQLNRGWSERGRIYRKMERYCAKHEGVLCFSRPIYLDKTARPAFIEFGIVKRDMSLWVEQFNNQE